MCLNCGCERAHDDMGKPGVNLTYETIKKAADANGTTVRLMSDQTNGEERARAMEIAKAVEGVTQVEDRMR